MSDVDIYLQRRREKKTVMWHDYRILLAVSEERFRGCLSATVRQPDGEYAHFDMRHDVQHHQRTLTNTSTWRPVNHPGGRGLITDRNHRYCNTHACMLNTSSRTLPYFPQSICVSGDS